MTRATMINEPLLLHGLIIFLIHSLSHMLGLQQKLCP